MYEPSDLISLNYNNFIYQVRIIAIKLCDLKLEFTGIFDEFESYHFPTIRNQIPVEYKSAIETEFRALDLSFTLSSQTDEKSLVVYLRSESTKGLQVSLNPQATHAHYAKIANLKPGAVIGRLVNVTQNDKINIFLIDQSSKIKVQCRNLNEYVHLDWIIAKLGNEIIKFKCASSVGEDFFEIHNIIRGAFATEQYIHNHHLGEDFLLLEVNPNFIGISQELLAKNIGFRLTNHSNVQEISFVNNSSKLLPVFIEQSEICSGFIKLKWRLRMRDADNWFELENKSYEFEINVIKNEITIIYTTIYKNLDIKLDDTPLSGKIIINIITKIAGSTAVSAIATKTITI